MNLENDEKDSKKDGIDIDSEIWMSDDGWANQYFISETGTVVRDYSTQLKYPSHGFTHLWWILEALSSGMNSGINIQED